VPIVLALPMLGGSICGEVLADISQRELILEPVAEITFEVDSGSVEVYAFNRNGISLFYYLIGSLHDIGVVDWALVQDRLDVVSACDDLDHCNVNWYAEIAFGTGVDVVTHIGGVKITGVDGPITADVSGGGFDGVHLRAPTLDLTVEAGDATIETLVVPTSARISVGEGNVQLTLPPGTYACELDTADGMVDTTGVTCDATATAIIHVDVEVGDIVLLPGPMP
jgi:hypothetical protein